MSVLMLSYDLNGHERPEAYDEVEQMIADHAISAIKPLYSQWFIETNESLQAWHERMKVAADENDHWFIHPVSKPRQGWLSKSVWTWLDSRC